MNDWAIYLTIEYWNQINFMQWAVNESWCALTIQYLTCNILHSMLHDVNASLFISFPRVWNCDYETCIAFFDTNESKESLIECINYLIVMRIALYNNEWWLIFTLYKGLLYITIEYWNQINFMQWAVYESWCAPTMQYPTCNILHPILHDVNASLFISFPRAWNCDYETCVAFFDTNESKESLIECINYLIVMTIALYNNEWWLIFTLCKGLKFMIKWNYINYWT